MLNRLYRGRQGRFVVVASVMHPPQEALDQWGPLSPAGFITLDVLPERMHKRICDELEERSFAVINHLEVPEKAFSPVP